MAPMSSVLEDVRLPTMHIWSVFGHTNRCSEECIQEKMLAPLLQELGHVPDRILLPSEGHSSIYLQHWAESLRIQTQVFHADWARNGRVAQILRDDRMQKECTHALVFLSSKSNRMQQFAEKLVKKGKVVLTITDLSPTRLASAPSAHAATSANGRKSNKGTMLSFLVDLP